MRKRPYVNYRQNRPYKRRKTSYKSNNSTATFKRGVRTGNGVTDHVDRSTVYKRRRMPYKKRRNWRRFSRKVVAVHEKQLVNRSLIVSTREVNSGPAGPGFQGVTTILHGGLHGSAYPTSPYLELPDLVHRAWANDTDLGADRNRTMIIKSCVTDITMLNETASTLEVDVYEGPLHKGGNADFWFRDILHAIADVPQSGSYPSIDIVSRGATPFNIPQIMSYTGWKIDSKKKYYLEPLKACTYQIRTSKDIRINSDAVASGTGSHFEYVLKGLTRACLVIYKIVGPVAGDETASLHFSISRHLTYTFEGCNERADAYLALPP